MNERSKEDGKGGRGAVVGGLALDGEELVDGEADKVRAHRLRHSKSIQFTIKGIKFRELRE